MANVLMTRIAKKPRKVKPRKAKPRIKKKKVLTPNQRSRAAKKGWKNRKKREREFLRKARSDKKKKGPSDLQVVDFIIRDLSGREDVLLALRAMDADEKEDAIQRMVKAYAEAELVEVEEDSEITAIRTRLRIADAEGNLEEVMAQVGLEYDMTPQEVYTQWLYSGVQ
jgi:hypothetical protein